MNLAVAVTAASIEAVKATQASVTHDMNERRGRPGLAGPLLAAGLAAAGLGGAAVATGGELDVLTGAGSLESSLLIGISQIIKKQWVRRRGGAYN